MESLAHESLAVQQFVKKGFWHLHGLCRVMRQIKNPTIIVVFMCLAETRLTSQMDVETILQQLSRHTELHQLPLATIMAFISQATSFKCDIIQSQPLSVTPDQPPYVLPLSVANFLPNSLAISLASIQDCWNIFRFDIWDHPGPEAQRLDKASFCIWGHNHGFSKLSNDYL